MSEPVKNRRGLRLWRRVADFFEELDYIEKFAIFMATFPLSVTIIGSISSAAGVIFTASVLSISGIYITYQVYKENQQNKRVVACSRNTDENDENTAKGKPAELVDQIAQELEAKVATIRDEHNSSILTLEEIFMPQIEVVSSEKILMEK